MHLSSTKRDQISQSENFFLIFALLKRLAPHICSLFALARCVNKIDLYQLVEKPKLNYIPRIKNIMVLLSVVHLKLILIHKKNLLFIDIYNVLWPTLF